MTTGSYYALLFTLAQYLQTGLDDSALVSGLILVPWVAAFGLGRAARPAAPRASSADGARGRVPAARRRVPGDQRRPLRLAEHGNLVLTVLLDRRRPGSSLQSYLISHLTTTVPGDYAPTSAVWQPPPCRSAGRSAWPPSVPSTCPSRTTTPSRPRHPRLRHLHCLPRRRRSDRHPHSPSRDPSHRILTQGRWSVPGVRAMPGPEIWTLVWGAPAGGSVLSRPPPPSAARSAGSARARTPSAVRARWARRSRARWWPRPRPRSCRGS